MKKRFLTILIATTMLMSCVGCGNTQTDTHATEHMTETEIMTELVAEPQNVTTSELAPLAETGIITGVEDIKIQENTDVDLNELVYVDETIVKSVDIDDSNVDYTKAGVYEVIYTITFDETALNEYLANNNVNVSFATDTDSDTIIVKTTITVEIVTEEVATEIIESNENVDDDEKEIIVTNETKEDVKTENKSQANDNAMESKPSADTDKPAEQPVDKKDESVTTEKTDNTSANTDKTDKSDNQSTANSEKPANSNTNENKQNTSTEKPSNNKTEDKPAEKPAETKPVHTHSYTNKVTKNATCTSKGTRTYTCNCGNSYTEDIAKLDHQYDNGKVTTAATCANAGVKTFTCSCGKTRTESIAKTTHNYDNGTVTKQPTCNANGQKTFKCTTCSATYTEDIAAVAHDWKHHEATGHEEKILVKEAWDEDQYEPAVVCGGCGKTFTGNNAVNDCLDHCDMDFWDDCENYSVKQVKVGTIHHEAEYTTKWIQDSPAYDQCTKCGTKK